MLHAVPPNSRTLILKSREAFLTTRKMVFLMSPAFHFITTFQCLFLSHLKPASILLQLWPTPILPVRPTSILLSPYPTLNPNPPSSACQRHHVFASFSVSDIRALLAHILPHFLQCQLNTDQFTDPQQHSGQPVTSIQAPANVQVAALPDNQVCLQLFFDDYC